MTKRIKKRVLSVLCLAFFKVAMKLHSKVLAVRKEIEVENNLKTESGVL